MRTKIVKRACGSCDAGADRRVSWDWRKMD
jgi:hypothetical protein